jgi:hypothetical protein
MVFLFSAKRLTPNSQILLHAGFSSLDWLDLEMQRYERENQSFKILNEIVKDT